MAVLATLVAQEWAAEPALNSAKAVTHPSIHPANVCKTVPLATSSPTIPGALASEGCPARQALPHYRPAQHAPEDHVVSPAVRT